MKVLAVLVGSALLGACGAGAGGPVANDVADNVAVIDQTPQTEESAVAQAIVDGDVARLSSIAGSKLVYMFPGAAVSMSSVAPGEVLAKLTNCKLDRPSENEARLTAQMKDTSVVLRCDTAEPPCTQARFRIAKTERAITVAYVGEWARKASDSPSKCAVRMEPVDG